MKKIKISPEKYNKITRDWCKAKKEIDNILEKLLVSIYKNTK